MISQPDVDQFIGGLSSTLRTLISTISQKEPWTCDGDEEVESLITQLDDILDSVSPAVLAKASHLMLANSAYFSLERFICFISLVSKKDPFIVGNILDKETAALITDGQLYLKTVVDRLMHLVQTTLIQEIFDPVAIQNLNYAILENAGLSDDDSTKDSSSQLPPKTLFPELDDIVTSKSQNDTSLIEKIRDELVSSKADHRKQVTEMPRNITADIPQKAEDQEPTDIPDKDIISTSDKEQVKALLQALVSEES